MSDAARSAAAFLRIAGLFRVGWSRVLFGFLLLFVSVAVRGAGAALFGVGEAGGELLWGSEGEFEVGSVGSERPGGRQCEGWPW